MTTVKYSSGYRKHKYELADETEKQPNRIFINQELETIEIVNCRATEAHKFRIRLRSKQHDVILTKERSVLTKIKDSSEGENMETKCSVLGYRIDTCFDDYKPAIEIDEKW